MRQQEFIDALYEAGWVSRNDAQHDHIKVLHKKLFPLVTELEIILSELDNDNYRLSQREIELEAIIQELIEDETSMDGR